MGNDLIYTFKSSDDSCHLEFTLCQTGSRLGDIYIDFNVKGDAAYFFRMFMLRGKFGGGHYSHPSHAVDPHATILDWLINLRNNDKSEKHVAWLTVFATDPVNLDWRCFIIEDSCASDGLRLEAQTIIAPIASCVWAWGCHNHIVNPDNENHYGIFDEHVSCAKPVKIDTSENPLLEQFLSELYSLGMPLDYPAPMQSSPATMRSAGTLTP